MPTSPTSRRTRFREYMARMDPSGDPLQAIAHGLVVSRAGSVAEQISQRLELRPASTHLLVGGIGSGKTTQLLIARDLLHKVGDLHALYIDISARQDLDRLGPGAVVAVVGLVLSEILEQKHETLSSDSRAAARNLYELANGYIEPYLSQLEDYPSDPDWVPGAIHPPAPVPEQVKPYLDPLRILRRHLLPPSEHLVILLDALDRVTDLGAFAKMLQTDLAGLHSLGIGLALAGPLRAMYGLERALVDRFDHVYHQSPVDAGSDQAGLTFLVDVLRQRASEDMLPTEMCGLLARYSGGMLRDLLSLARHAGDAAYLDGAEYIQLEHVHRAADDFGRSLMIGLTPADIASLQDLRLRGTFIPTTEEQFALLATRRVLEYRGRDVRYAVHPTLVPLLEQLAEARP